VRLGLSSAKCEFRLKTKNKHITRIDFFFPMKVFSTENLKRSKRLFHPKNGTAKNPPVSEAGNYGLKPETLRSENYFHRSLFTKTLRKVGEETSEGFWQVFLFSQNENTAKPRNPRSHNLPLPKQGYYGALTGIGRDNSFIC